MIRASISVSVLASNPLSSLPLPLSPCSLSPFPVLSLKGFEGDTADTAVLLEKTEHWVTSLGAGNANAVSTPPRTTRSSSTSTTTKKQNGLNQATFVEHIVGTVAPSIPGGAAGEKYVQHLQRCTRNAQARGKPHRLPRCCSYFSLLLCIATIGVWTWILIRFSLKGNAAMHQRFHEMGAVTLLTYAGSQLCQAIVVSLVIVCRMRYCKKRAGGGGGDGEFGNGGGGGGGGSEVETKTTEAAEGGGGGSELEMVQMENPMHLKQNRLSAVYTSSPVNLL